MGMKYRRQWVYLLVIGMLAGCATVSEEVPLEEEIPLETEGVPEALEVGAGDLDQPVGFPDTSALEESRSLEASDGVLHPEPDRMTDETLAEDIRTIDALQKRLEVLNAAETPVSSYRFAKASAWVDFAYREYVKNDRTGIIEEALSEAQWIIQALEQKSSDGMETTMMKDDTRLREDLWQRVAALKAHRDFHCAEAETAQLEVRLVRAGHEYQEMGWRHARSEVRVAEQLEQEAQAKLAACPQPVAKVVPPPPPPPLPPPPPPPGPTPIQQAVQKMEVLATRVHFALDEAIIYSSTAEVLDAIGMVLRAHPDIKLQLTGHADRRGSVEYNLALSIRRAEATRDYLASIGIAPDRIKTGGVGKTESPESDETPEEFARSRRAKFIFFDATDVRQAEQFRDLQIEER
jgi:outer membrane protein OmpA-like peptidoglycan-associated protein